MIRAICPTLGPLRFPFFLPCCNLGRAFALVHPRAFALLAVNLLQFFFRGLCPSSHVYFSHWSVRTPLHIAEVSPVLLVIVWRLFSLKLCLRPTRRIALSRRVLLVSPMIRPERTFIRRRDFFVELRVLCQVPPLVTHVFVAYFRVYLGPFAAVAHTIVTRLLHHAFVFF